MRLTNVQSNTAVGVPKNNAYGPGAVSPASSTQRWTYTVPAGKRNRVASMASNCVRDTVATTAGIAYCYVQYTPSGGAASNNAVSIENGNVVGGGQNANLGAALVMGAGDIIAGFTADQSTGGSCDLQVSWAGNEFDG